MNVIKQVLLVDVNDIPIGYCEKVEAHKKAKLHRAFSIFLVNNGKILIQKRASNKYHSGGLWANACCSHPLSEDIIEEANIRLGEELGIKKWVVLKELFTFTYFYKFNDDLFEHEIDHVLLGEYNENIILNPDEAEEYEWLSVKDLSDELSANPQKFTCWFLICAPKIIEYLKKTSVSA